MFRRSSTPTPRDKCDFRLLLWGNGANTGQLAYLRRHFILTGNDGTETRARTWRLRDPSGHTSMPSFVAAAHLLREISATSGSYYGVTGPIRAS
ncbi:hypothetical protein DPMN_025666 [Dreissena polymorpha]|uniref:Uncharacterized protein n=1 Tax=Dreissena polymorpha TaxID=45954 RepID=A0A9D4RCR6_DREPO|nr:hypothetical protein DPMN_025666 [Dreissena polymorpha]